MASRSPGLIYRHGIQISVVFLSLILAITIYPLHQSLARRFGGKQGRASIVIVVVGVLLIGVPFIMLAESFAVHIQDLNAGLSFCRTQRGDVTEQRR